MTRVYRSLLVLGLVAGLLGDALFNGAGFGLNLPVWVGAVVLAAAWLGRSASPGDRVLPWLLGLAVFFAACVAWRDSPFLQSWNTVAVLCVGVAVVVHLRGRLTRTWPEGYLAGAAVLAGHVAGGAAQTIGDAARARDPSIADGRVRAWGIGLALAVPVLLVFGGLLASADPVLEAFAEGLFAWEPGPLVEHALLTLVFAWIAIGALRAVTARRASGDAVHVPAPFRLGATEIAVPLGVLAVLLAVFIGLQARYLFGGTAVIESTGLTYAEFARQGFFELVFLSLLVVPLLYGAHWVLDRHAAGAVRSFRALVVVLCLLVGLVMVSALTRMALYVGAYGLTDDRLYATAFMLWVGSVLAWFAVTELRSETERFATGAVAAGFAVLAALNVLNPDALIARTNLARAAEGQELDAEYLARLSLDAVPAVAERWAVLDDGARCTVRSDLLARAGTADDWRGWTWGRAAAARAVAGMPPTALCPDS